MYESRIRINIVINKRFPNFILKLLFESATKATTNEKMINLIYGRLVFKECHLKSEIIDDVTQITQNNNKNLIKILFKLLKLFFLKKKNIAKIVIIKSGKKGPVIKNAGTNKSK